MRSTGFKSGFLAWAAERGYYASACCIPHSIIVSSLKNEVYSWVRRLERQHRARVRSARKFDVLFDWTKGGALAFRSLREPDYAPLTITSRKVSTYLVRQRLSRHDHTILVRDARAFKLEFPIVINDHKYWIRSIQRNRLYLTKPVTVRCVTAAVTQTIAVTDPKELLDAAHSEMEQWWNCDPVDQQLQNLPPASPIHRYLQATAKPTPLPFSPFSWETWKTGTRGCKNTSARGICGFSARDLKILPEVLASLFIAIFRPLRKAPKAPPGPSTGLLRQPRASLKLRTLPVYCTRAPLQCSGCYTECGLERGLKHFLHGCPVCSPPLLYVARRKANAQPCGTIHRTWSKRTYAIVLAYTALSLI